MTHVIQLGVPENENQLRQREGRGCRILSMQGLVILLAETWAYGRPPPETDDLVSNRRQTQLTKQDRTQAAIYD